MANQYTTVAEVSDKLAAVISEYSPKMAAGGESPEFIAESIVDALNHLSWAVRVKQGQAVHAPIDRATGAVSGNKK